MQNDLHVVAVAPNPAEADGQGKALKPLDVTGDAAPMFVCGAIYARFAARVMKVPALAALAAARTRFGCCRRSRMRRLGARPAIALCWTGSCRLRMPLWWIWRARRWGRWRR